MNARNSPLSLSETRVKILDRIGQCHFSVRLGLAFIAGSIANLALPPLNLFFLLWAAFPFLLFLSEFDQSRKMAFMTGWSFGFGFFLFGLYWISFALMTDFANYWYFLPLAIAGLPAGLAIFPGLVMFLLHIGKFSGIARVLIFSFLWSASEWIRGHILTGFPWHILGYSWSGSLEILQVVSITGIYGLGAITILVASFPILLIDQKISPVLARSLCLGAIVILLSFWLWGHSRLAHAPKETFENIGIKIIQPNIKQEEKWVPDLYIRHFNQLLDLSKKPVDPDHTVTHIIWPETATAWFLLRHQWARESLSQIIPPNGFLLTGMLRSELDEHGTPKRFFNSLSVMDKSGHFIAHADKSHLVPFGEYIPFKKFLPFSPIAAGMADFTPGPGPLNLKLPNTPPFTPLICYEIIFPGEVTNKSDRPKWLLNVTNDAWYGHTAGPYQHLAIARARSIEEGLPLVRAANTGISAIFDGWGRLYGRLGLGKEGYLYSSLPKPLPKETLYSKYADTILFIILALYIITAYLDIIIRKHRYK